MLEMRKLRPQEIKGIAQGHSRILFMGLKPKLKPVRFVFQCMTLPHVFLFKCLSFWLTWPYINEGDF